MRHHFIISGTDTGIGKTTVAAMLTLVLDGVYWKPLQSGTAGGTDTQRVQALTALPADRFVPESYVFAQPLSPHRAAELDGVMLDVAKIAPPVTTRPLIIEGAGGLLVPVTRALLQVDIFAAWQIPVILCARTGLGTINHTLLSLEALRYRKMAVHGIIFVGEDNPDTMRTIQDFSACRILGRMPHLERIDHASLARVFAENFRAEDFQ